MSGHQLAIAKATLAASLLRQDPEPVPKDEIAHFHQLLASVSSQCSRANVQNCKRWIVARVAHSPNRTQAFGKYLVALSSSYQTTSNTAPADDGSRRPSSKRKRLALLYLLNDLLFQLCRQTSLMAGLEPFLKPLFLDASSYSRSPKHFRKLHDLLDLWEQRQYRPQTFIQELHALVDKARDASATGKAITSEDLAENASTKLAKDTPYLLPATHGDQSLPWYDQPAANLVQHIVPNSTRPINPAHIRPLELSRVNPDKQLVSAVQALLHDAEGLYGFHQDAGGDEGVAMDVDALGQVFRKGLDDGSTPKGDSYYGWSVEFCQKMQERKDGRSRARRSSSRSSFGSDG